MVFTSSDIYIPIQYVNVVHHNQQYDIAAYDALSNQDSNQFLLLAFSMHGNVYLSWGISSVASHYYPPPDVWGWKPIS